MDKKNLKEDIERRYQREYYAAALAAQKGLRGTFLRLFTSKTGRSNLRFPALAAVTFAAALAVTAFMPALTIVPVAVWATGFLGTLGASLIADRPVSARAKKAINADLDNGTLISRYKHEVIDRRLNTLPIWQTELKEASKELSELELNPQFLRASANSAKAEKPKHRRRIHFGRKPKI